MDDGWFGSRRNDRAGLGDWVAAKEIFPEGIGALAQKVEDLGMKFGIWIEPEMVNPDSDLYRTHPEFFYHGPDGKPGNKIVSSSFVLVRGDENGVLQYGPSG